MNDIRKAICVLCHISLSHIKKEDNPYQFRCLSYHKINQLYYEVMAYESDRESIIDNEQNTIELEGLEGVRSPNYLVLEDELDFDKDIEKEENKLPISKYMKNSDTREVVEYHEE